MRKVCVAGQPEMPPFEGALPELAWIAIGDIVVDDTYQRPLGKSNWAIIRRIAQNFDWSMFSPVLLAPAGRGYAVIDGQHRVHAAKMRGIPRVPAMLVQAGTAGQARAFSWVNGSVTRITPWHVYKAALAAGEDWSLRARDAVAAGNCQLMTFNKSTKDKKSGEIFSVTLIRRLIEAGKNAVVADGLGALWDYDHSGKRVALYCNDLISPWLMAIGNQDRAHLRQVLERNDPFVVMERVDTALKAGALKGSATRLYRNCFALAMQDG